MSYQLNLFTPKRLNKHLRTIRYRGKHQFASIIEGIRRRCRGTDILCDLNMAWGRETYTGYCSLTNLPFVIIPGKTNAYHPSVDRIDPTKGYVKTNCRWVLYSINSFKGTGTDADMAIIANALLNNVNTKSINSQL